MKLQFRFQYVPTYIDRYTQHTENIYFSSL
jgi:hypothetical protein